MAMMKGDNYFYFIGLSWQNRENYSTVRTVYTELNLTRIILLFFFCSFYSILQMKINDIYKCNEHTFKKFVRVLYIL